MYVKLALSDERKKIELIVFKTKVPRKIFIPKRVKVTRGWVKVHYERFRDLYLLPDIVNGIQ
jgi:hypothetical protein